MEMPPPPTIVEPPLHQPTPEEEEMDEFDQGESKAEGRAMKEAEQTHFIENVMREHVLVDVTNRCKLSIQLVKQHFCSPSRDILQKYYPPNVLGNSVFCTLSHLGLKTSLR
jgi:hypothetical protein